MIATKTYKSNLKSIWEENLGVDVREDSLASVGDVGNEAVPVVSCVGDL